MGVLSAATSHAAPTTGDPLHGADGATGTMSEILDALGQGRHWINARYRYEFVEADKVLASGEQAYASTLRTVLGYESGAWNGFRGTIEFENITTIGNQQFHDGLNSKYAGVLPTVADPEVTDINLVFLDYEGLEDNTVRLGRQTVILDNARFVGNVGWRQNDQTFDAVTVTNTMVEHLKLFYSYLQNVNTIKGTDAPMSSHLLNANYEVGVWGNITGYAYLLDYDNHSSSTNTFGARWTAGRTVGDQVDLKWALEAATQADNGDTATNVDANYYHGEVAAKFASAPAGMVVTTGFEVLEGNADKAGDKFTTPLATGHKFNGWADMFLTTPNAGLQDMYIGLSGKADKANWALVYHTFDAQDGNMTWGDELDAILTYPCSKRVTVGVKVAAYASDEWKEDVSKLWLWLGINP